MAGIGGRFFGFKPEEVDVFIDDGRHFIAETARKYDLVVVDVLRGESQAYHLLTLEAIGSIRSILKDNGMLLFNFQGSIIGPSGRAARSVLKTLKTAGLQVSHYQGEGSDSDILFVAAERKINIDRTDESRLNLCCQILAFEPFELLSNRQVDLEDAIVFTDDRPIFNKMNLPWVERWRRSTVENFSLDQTSISFSLMSAQ